MFIGKIRPKSAPPPPKYFWEEDPLSPRFESDSEKPARRSKNTLEERMNRFHTTGRVLNRMKERRRTEADIIVNEKPSGLLAMEIPSRKLTQAELENLTARVCRPTAAYSARVASSRRINAKDIYVPPKQVMRIEYYNVEHGRFKGTKPLSARAVSSLVNRLSVYDAERRPAESKDRHAHNHIRERLGSVASYRWLGLKNC